MDQATTSPLHGIMRGETHNGPSTFMDTCWGDDSTQRSHQVRDIAGGGVYLIEDRSCHSAVVKVVRSIRRGIRCPAAAALADVKASSGRETVEETTPKGFFVSVVNWSDGQRTQRRLHRCALPSGLMHIHSSFCDKFTVSCFSQRNEVLVVEKVRTKFYRKTLNGGAAWQLAMLYCMGEHRRTASHESVPQAEGPAEASKELVGCVRAFFGGPLENGA